MACGVAVRSASFRWRSGDCGGRAERGRSPAQAARGTAWRSGVELGSSPMLAMGTDRDRELDESEHARGRAWPADATRLPSWKGNPERGRCNGCASRLAHGKRRTTAVREPGVSGSVTPTRNPGCESGGVARRCKDDRSAHDTDRVSRDYLARIRESVALRTHRGGRPPGAPGGRRLERERAACERPNARREGRFRAASDRAVADDRVRGERLCRASRMRRLRADACTMLAGEALRETSDARLLR